MSSVIDNKCRQASCKIQRTSKARDSYKQCSIPNKSQAMNSVLKGFICILQLCQLKADFDPAINVIFLLWFIDTPNNPTNDDTTARDLAWVAQHPLHVWRHRCEMDSTPPPPWHWVHSQSAAHPQIGFILDSSATSLHRKREMYLPAQQWWHGMAWSAASFFRKCLPGESERARAKSEGRMNHRSIVKWYPFWRSRPEGLLWSHVPHHGVSRNVWEFIVRSKCEWNVQISIRRSPCSEKYAIHAKKSLFSRAKIHLMAL